MFRVIFLGTSGGTPTVERGMPAIAIKYESELMLWDCGEGTQRQLMKYKVGYGSIDTIFVTHPHIDHYLGMYGLLETLKMSSPSPKKLKLFLPKGVDAPEYPFITHSPVKSGELMRNRDFTVNAFQVKHCRGSYGLVFEEQDKVKFHEEKAHSLGLEGRLFKEIQKKGSVKTPKGEVKLEDVTWKKPGRKVVYSGDCVPDENVIEAAKGADLLIHEGTFETSLKDEALEKLHSTVADAAEIAKKSSVKRLIITHISPRHSDAAALLKEAMEIFPNTIIAEDGLALDL